MLTVNSFVNSFVNTLSPHQTEGHVNAVACDPQRATEFVTAGRDLQFWILDHKQELSVATGSLPIQFVRRLVT